MPPEEKIEYGVPGISGIRDYPDGVWACLNYFECTRVCPKEIPVTKEKNIMKRGIEKVKK